MYKKALKRPKYRKKRIFEGISPLIHPELKVKEKFCGSALAESILEPENVGLFTSEQYCQLTFSSGIATM